MDVVSEETALRFSPALFIFHIEGGLTFSCNEDWSHGLFGVLGQCLATVSQDHDAATRAPTQPLFVQTSLGL